MIASAGAVHRAGPAELFLWLFRRRRRYRIDGDSMAPTLAAGDYVLAWPGAPCGVGDVVVARHPDGERVVVKRIAAVGPGGLDLRGDNPEGSTDSRSWGPVSWDRVLGRVTSRAL